MVPYLPHGKCKTTRTNKLDTLTAPVLSSGPASPSGPATPSLFSNGAVNTCAINSFRTKQTRSPTAWCIEYTRVRVRNYVRGSDISRKPIRTPAMFAFSYVRRGDTLGSIIGYRTVRQLNVRGGRLTGNGDDIGYSVQFAQLFARIETRQ